MTIVEPGGARTAFRYGGARVAKLTPTYDNNPAHAFLRMLDPKNGLAPGDPARMAARIIESVDAEPAPLRMVLGSLALESTLSTLRKRIEGFEAQRELAVSTDFPPGACPRRIRRKLGVAGGPPAGRIAASKSARELPVATGNRRRPRLSVIAGTRISAQPRPR